LCKINLICLDTYFFMRNSVERIESALQKTGGLGIVTLRRSRSAGGLERCSGPIVGRTPVQAVFYGSQAIPDEVNGSAVSPLRPGRRNPTETPHAPFLPWLEPREPPKAAPSRARPLSPCPPGTPRRPARARRQGARARRRFRDQTGEESDPGHRAWPFLPWAAWG
jgi:hypothetical protein